ncbi:MAG: lycopene cyclase domain-containing protein [Halalkalicoccus sp.]
MIPPTTYLEFLAVAVVAPILLLSLRTLARPRARYGRREVVGVFVIVALAVVYTTPWDNYLIAHGVWWYGEGVVLTTLWYAPLGEYLFFVLQPVLTALWLYRLRIPTDEPLALSVRERVLGGAAGLAVGLVGLGLVLAGESTLYLGTILAWAGPILAIQWGFGWTQLWAARRTVLVAIAVPTLYLWIVDWVAISLGLWVISEQYTVGVAPFGLPVEEALFFLVTNVFIVQGLVLYTWLVERL